MAKNKKRKNFFKRLFESDNFIAETFWAVIIFILSFTVFRIEYIKGKTVLGIIFFIVSAILLAFAANLINEKFGGNRGFAKMIRANKGSFISFFIAVGIMIFAYLVYEIRPFGDYCVLEMDLYHQYGPLFAEFYDKIAQGKSLLYSWNSGGGSGFLGNFFNYLSSPLTPIIFWFSRIHIVDAIDALVLIKCAFSAASFSYFLKKHSNSKYMLNVPFALLYAFSAYFIAYYWNLMWLDAVVIFPFVMLGIEKIINERKGKLYIIALAATMLTNYYMAYMVCIFSCVYFLCYYWSHYSFTDLYVPKSKDLPFFSRIYQSKFINTGFKFVFCSVFAALISAFALIPVFLTLQSSSAIGGSFPSGFETYFDILDYIAAHFAMLEPTVRSSGGDVTPNVYCGILTILLIPLYMMSKKISWKEKTVNVALLAFFFICFNTNYLNFIWHGFHFPNDLPYRFSFFYSFILLIMAYRVFANIREYGYKTILCVGIGFIAFLALSQKFELRYVNGYTIYATIAFTALYILVICAASSKKVEKSILTVVLTCSVVSEIFICDIPKFGFSVNESDYTGDYNAYRSSINAVYEKDDSDDYRIELNDIPSALRMSPCWYNYEGISCFSSMASENLSDLQFRLGNFSNRINSFMYHNQTPVYNMMFGVKYVIDNNNPFATNSAYYDMTAFDDENSLKTYKNKYFSGLGFAVSNKLLEEFNYNEECNPFELQNDFMKYASNTDKDVFLPVQAKLNGTENCNITSFDGTGRSEFKKLSEEEDAFINMTFTVEKDANYYVFLATSKLENAVFRIDGKEKTQPIEDEPYVLDLGYLKEGTSVDIKALISDDANEGVFYPWIYYCDDNAFREAYDILADSGVFKIEEKTDTYVKGTVNTGKDELLYTSITYDKSWKVYVDGKETKALSLKDSLICVDTGEGEHTVEFKYAPQGLKTGVLISSLTIALTALFYILKYLILNKIRKIVATV